ncbi:MBL fold metallo-hydrolase [Streptomyces pathocidini]|uniref:MBL fold metallo-hydrolase n=1 Tax=Streptomyces pathocidini TaxID=1650571 RepID=A0ABW7UJJ2_9ACTN|nr:MBL fold metallo-hydrolase [Streptomyces pathocidini]
MATDSATEGIAVTRITHSCHLIEIGGLTLLTDPWFTERPKYHPGEPIASSVAELPDLDGVLISHHHYDHCDLAAFAAYRDKDVPMLVAAPVVERARKAGFRQVRALYPWESTRLGERGEVNVTGIPARHKVYEVTFVVQGGGRTVYFAGDTLLVPELKELAGRFPELDLLLVPTNGLRLRPLFNRQVVMSAEEAATLTSWLRPRVAVPHHYAYTSGRLGDRLLTKSDRDPQNYVRAARAAAPDTDIRVISPGERLTV